MSSPTELLADQAIAKLEADDAKAAADDDANNNQDKDPKGGEGGEGNDDKGAGAAADDGKGDPGGGAADDDAAGAGDDDKGGEGGDEPKGKFTADDGVELEDKGAGGDATQQQQTPAQQLTTGAQKYIADNIGEPITIRGIRGEGDNAKEVELKVYTSAEIPDDFKFLNDRELSAATTGFYNLEQKANKLLTDYQQQDATSTAQEFERRENEGIKADVADLQKAGQFPMFTKRPGETGFDHTAEAKQMQEVLDVMTEQNNLYMQQYQQGRPYKHIGFAEAFRIWQDKSPEQQARQAADKKQAAEDKQRKKQGAERGDANRGMSTSNIRKATVKGGTTVQDVLRRMDNED